MNRVLDWLRAVPGLLWAALAALGGLFLLLAGARRRGAAEGAARGTAAAETAKVEEMVHEAETTAHDALAGRAEAKSGEPPTVAQEVADDRARTSAERLRNDLLGRIRK